MTENTKIILSIEKPPIYEQCVKFSGVDWDHGIVITYGDTVHCKYALDGDLIAHEAVHVEQQIKMGKDEWWERYFRDVEFRLDQETQAYKAQVAWAWDNLTRQQAREIYRRVIKLMAHNYKGMCTEEEAKRLLQ